MKNIKGNFSKKKPKDNTSGKCIFKVRGPQWARTITKNASNNRMRKENNRKISTTVNNKDDLANWRNRSINSYNQPRKDNIRCFYTNANILPNKLNELKARINQSTDDIGIIGVTKHPQITNIHKTKDLYPTKENLQKVGLIGLQLKMTSTGQRYMWKTTLMLQR